MDMEVCHDYTDSVIVQFESIVEFKLIGNVFAVNDVSSSACVMLLQQIISVDLFLIPFWNFRKHDLLSIAVLI